MVRNVMDREDCPCYQEEYGKGVITHQGNDTPKIAKFQGSWFV